MGFLLTNLESGLVPLELISCFFWQNILRHLALYSCGFGITSKRLQLLVSSVCGNLRIVFGSGFAGLGFTRRERRVRPRFPSIWLIVKLQQERTIGLRLTPDALLPKAAVPLAA